MKRRILALGLFSLCCVGLFVAPVKAWCGLFSPWNCHNRYTTQITCRPYNAFTPICWGNLVCDGCCPSPCGAAAGCLPLTIGAPPWCCNYGMGGGPCMGGACGSSGSPGGCCASDMPMQMPMPDVRSQPFAPPMPMPMPTNLPGGPNMTMAYPPMPSGVSQANYYPNYYAGYYPQPYPAYYPYYPAAPMNYPAANYPSGPMPSYWYGQGR